MQNETHSPSEGDWGAGKDRNGYICPMSTTSATVADMCPLTPPQRKQ